MFCLLWSAPLSLVLFLFQIVDRTFKASVAVQKKKKEWKEKTLSTRQLQIFNSQCLSGPHLKQQRPRSPSAEWGRTASWISFKPAVWESLLAKKHSSFDLWCTRERNENTRLWSCAITPPPPPVNFSFLSGQKSFAHKNKSMFTNNLFHCLSSKSGN